MEPEQADRGRDGQLEEVASCDQGGTSCRAMGLPRRAVEKVRERMIVDADQSPWFSGMGSDSRIL